jgi:hypothetical protein
LNEIYGRISIILNDFENHRTESEYEDNLISKVFIFQLVNSFAALTYVSFIKYFLNIPCVKNNCIGDSATSLSTIFIVRLVASAIINVFVRQVHMKYAYMFVYIYTYIYIYIYIIFIVRLVASAIINVVVRQV